jgi:HPt (histidine-containing phosphotransfer) domain-containing protein
LSTPDNLHMNPMSHRWNPAPGRPTARAEAAMGARCGLEVLDAQALARLRELDPGGKAGLVDRVLRTYTQNLGRMLDQLGTARNARDLPALRHVAHALKSSSASVGALALSSQCADVEARVRDGDLEDFDDRLDALVAEGQRILAGLQPHAGQP